VVTAKKTDPGYHSLAFHTLPLCIVALQANINHHVYQASDHVIILTNIDYRCILRTMEVDVEKLTRLREDKVLSQRELARMAGLAQGTVWRLENGFSEAHPSTIRKLGEALGVEPRELVRKE
jgi:DNA-binding XRE family transcriptional regulator